MELYMDGNITCTILGEGNVICNGTHYHVVENKLTYLDMDFWIYLGIYVALTLGAGLMSGLTLGLLSLDTLSLEVLIKANSGIEAMYARRLLPIIRQHHLLLVTLLLGNAACVESMPIFLDRISDPILAILVSVTAVLFFGEIIPQAICKKYGLAVGYYTIPLVYFLMGLALIISWPISKILDCVFGHDTGTYYKRGQLKALVDLHGPPEVHYNSNTSGGTGNGHVTDGAGNLMITQDHWGSDSGQNFSVGNYYHLRTSASGHDLGSTQQDPSSSAGLNQSVRDALTTDEVVIIKGALDLTSKCARDAMVPLPRVYMMSSEDQLTRESINKLLCYAHSRVPVMLGHDNRMIQGILIVKMLIMVNPENNIPVKDLMKDPNCFRPIPYVTETTPLYDLLNLFQTGKTGHMAVVVKDDIAEDQLDILEQLYEQGGDVDLVAVYPPVIGIITLEDVIEQLIQESIEDESDIHRRQLCRRLLQKQKKKKKAAARRRSYSGNRRPSSRAGLELSANTIADAVYSASEATDATDAIPSEATCFNLLNRYLDTNDIPPTSDNDEKTPLFPDQREKRKYMGYVGV